MLVNIPLKSHRFLILKRLHGRINHYFAVATETTYKTEKLMLFVIQL